MTVVEAPELTYKMAPLSVKAEPSEYGKTYCNYAIEVNEIGFTFDDVVIYDKKTGEECGWDNGYDWTEYPGKICVSDTPADCRGCMEGRIRAMGRYVATSKGFRARGVRRGHGF